MRREFEYKNEKWEAEMTGWGLGGRAGSVPPSATKWSVRFRGVRDSSQSVRGWIGKPELNAVKENELCVALERALTKK